MISEVKPLVSAWFPMTDTNTVRALGKTLEELGEATSAVARCLIQGIDESEPVTGKPNRQWLEDEIADVWTQFNMLIDIFELDHERMLERTYKKEQQMKEWRAML